MPDHAAFIDLYFYRKWDIFNSKLDHGHDSAFVLCKGGPVRRVELGDAKTIETDLTQWRADVGNNFGGESSSRLRKNLWKPLAGVLAKGVDTVYFCPDGALNALPWSALPGDRPGSVLLENYIFAVCRTVHFC